MLKHPILQTGDGNIPYLNISEGTPKRSTEQLGYTVNYAVSLKQMSKNLKIYGNMVDVKVQEKEQLKDKIASMK